MAIASLYELRVSTNGGITWEPPVPARLPGNYLFGGDESLAFDSQGRLFWCNLGKWMGTFGPTGGNDLFVVECDPATGQPLHGWVNVTQQIGMPASASHAHDKQWLIVDDHPGSPYADRLHLSWVRFPLGGGVGVVYTSRSSDHGLTWTPALQLGAANPSLNWPPHMTTAPNGDVYAAIHCQPSLNPGGTSGFVRVHRSIDGGASYPQETVAYPSGSADMTWNRQGTVGSVPGAVFTLQGSWQPWLLADPNVSGRIYVVASDDPDNDVTAGDAANVYLVRSTDFGATWGAPIRVDSGPGSTLQVMPTAGIDPQSGAIAVYWYDNRAGLVNANGHFLLDVFAAVSSDGGASFLPDFQVNDLPFDPDAGARCYAGCGPTLFDIWAGPGSAAFAVASSGHILAHDGAGWSIIPGASARPKFGVWGTSATNVFACGAGGEIVQYTGVLTLQASGTAQDLFRIDGRSASDVFAVGANGSVVHYDGSGWSPLASGTTQHLHDVWANPTGSTFVVGSNGTVRRYDGTWFDLSIGTAENLYGVWGTSDTDFYVSSIGGALYHWNGAWTSVPTLVGQIGRIWSAGAGQLLVPGEGRIDRYDGNWSSEGITENLLFRVHGTAANNVFTVGDNAFIAHFDGLAWTTQPNPLVPVAPTLRIGEYNGVALAWGKAHLVWCGNEGDGVSEPMSQQAVFDVFPTGTLVAVGDTEVTPPAPELTLRAPAPTPTFGTARIEFELLRESEVELSLFDVTGRQVAMLLHDRRPAGPHAIAWQPRDPMGRDLPSGVYFLKLSTQRGNQARRVVLVR